VKNEKLDFLSENTNRDACLIAADKEVHATFCDADRRAVPRDDGQGRGEAHVSGLAYGQRSRKIYMREQIHRAGHPKPKVIGVDEIAIRKGHTYRIVVSDLEKRRAIWFGGEGRTEKDMDLFYAFLGRENTRKIRRDAC
jgi:hypothetical protein